jgi:hypothetical protein
MANPASKERPLLAYFPQTASLYFQDKYRQLGGRIEFRRVTGTDIRISF